MHPMITIVPIGLGQPETLTAQCEKALRNAARLFLRTGRHPLSAWLDSMNIPYQTMDAIYDASENFEEAYAQMASILWEQARQKAVVYAVPDSLQDASVAMLYATQPSDDSRILQLPGVSVTGIILSAGRSLLQQQDLRLISAANLTQNEFEPGLPLLVTEIDNAQLAGDLKICLSEYLEDEATVYLFQSDKDQRHLGFRALPLYELDRLKKYDHLTAMLWPGAGLLERSRYTARDLVRVMDSLLAPGGCPWDRDQSHASLRPYLVEEAWEAVNAIDEEDYDHLADELGDVLLQIVFHAAIGKRFDEFTLTDVTTHICEKMIQRHPHVFGHATAGSAGEVADSWETIKRRETGSRTVGESLEDVSVGLPALKYAIKLQKKAMQLPGFRREPKRIAVDIQDCAAQLILPDGKLNEKALGLLLLRSTELSHRCQADAEILLHETADLYKQSFQQYERQLLAEGKPPEDMNAEELYARQKLQINPS